jgi:probable phosphoglycerate mutase
MEATRICLVRHGETSWNAEKRIQGQIDIGLNAAGQVQAEAAANWLVEPTGDGTLQQRPAAGQADCRAHRSAARTCCRRFRAGVPGTSLRVFFEGPDLRRIARAGIRLTTTRSRRATRSSSFPFGGESLQQLSRAGQRRAARQFAAGHRGQTIVVVTHGGVLDIVNRSGARAVRCPARVIS